MGKLRIMGCEYECRMTGRFGERESLGLTNTDTQLMTFAEDMPDSLLERTVIHEIIEALRDALKMKLQHDDIDRLDATLYEALTSNGVDLSPLRRAVKGE